MLKGMKKHEDKESGNTLKYEITLNHVSFVRTLYIFSVFLKYHSSSDYLQTKTVIIVPFGGRITSPRTSIKQILLFLYFLARSVYWVQTFYLKEEYRSTWGREGCWN